MQVAKTLTYPVMCPFPLFVAICDHNAPTLQTDGQTNVMLVARNKVRPAKIATVRNAEHLGRFSC